MKVRYGLVGFGGIAENRIAKEGFVGNWCRIIKMWVSFFEFRWDRK